MLAQLQALEQTVLAMKKQYTITATELANTKQRIAKDDSPQRIQALSAEVKSITQNLDAKSAQVAELEEMINGLQQQIDELTDANQALTIQNQELRDKNQLAIARAEVVQKWLIQIDNSQRDHTNA